VTCQQVEQRVTSQGRPFSLNHYTHTETWEDPRIHGGETEGTMVYEGETRIWDYYQVGGSVLR
jgi:hypothetical protein